jgi:prepilin-type N-terminal cleavage/methylation domain-containing protein
MNANRCEVVRFRWSAATGFSLVEILASVVVLSVAALGITAAWRLADQKALAVRLDDRATRILREFYELQTFAPDYLFSNQDISPGEDPDAIGGPLTPGESREGFLYHPRKRGHAQSGNEYEDEDPFTILLSADGSTLTLTYQSQFLTGNQPAVQKEISLIPRSSAK